MEMTFPQRERIIDSAIALFNEHSYHSIDEARVAVAAGISVDDLAGAFPGGKESLVLAALDRRDEWARNYFCGEMDRRGGGDARRSLLSLFDVMGEWFAQGTFQGCMFINATAEYGKRDNPIHKAAARHKRLFCAYLRNLAEQIGTSDPDGLTDELVFLMEGAIVTAHIRGDASAAARAGRAAATLIDHATNESASNAREIIS